MFIIELVALVCTPLGMVFMPIMAVRIVKGREAAIKLSDRIQRQLGA